MIVGRVATHRVVLAIDGREAEVRPVVGLLHQRGAISLGDELLLVEGIGFVVARSSHEEGFEGRSIDASLGCTLVDQRTHVGKALLGPVVVPGVDALLLHTLGNEEFRRVGIFGHEALLLQRIEFLGHEREVLDGLLHRCTTGSKVLVTVARIGLLTHQCLGLGKVLGPIAQIAHVGIEIRTSNEIISYANDGQHSDDSQQGFVAVDGIGIDAVDHLERMTVQLVLPFVEERWQERQREHRSTHDGKGGKQAEVLQQVRLDKDQTQERTDGGDAAHQDGLHLVLEHLYRVAHVLVVGDDVQHVAQGHTQHDGADAQGKQRELSLDEVHHRQAEHRAEGDGQQQERDGVPVAEAQEDDQQHDDQRPHDVVLDVLLQRPRVIGTIGRRTVITDLHAWGDGLELLDIFVHPLEEDGAVARVGAGKPWCDDHGSHGRIGHEKVLVDNRVTSTRIHQSLHLVHQHITHADGVDLQQLGEGLADERSGLRLVLLQLLQDVCLGLQRVEARIGRSVDVVGQMLHHVVDALEHDVVGVHLAEEVANGAHVLGALIVTRLYRVAEGIHHVAERIHADALAVVEDDERLVLDPQAREGELDASVLVPRRWQQACNVLLQVDLGRKIAEETQQKSPQCNPHHPVLVEEMIYSNEKVCHYYKKILRDS